MPFSCFAGNHETHATKAEAQQWLSTQNQKGFIENRGQMTDMDGKPVPFVLFRTEAPGLNFWITETGLVIQTLKTEEDDESREPEAEENKMRECKDEIRKIRWERIDIELKGAGIKKSNIVKEQAAQGHSNYFFSHCPDGIYDVKEYEKVTIKEAYPGIDWELYRKPDGTLKYDFIVHPGADYRQIELVYKSKTPLKINEQGQLELFTDYGNVKENTPVSFYEGKEISTEFIQQEQRLTGAEENSFETSVHFNLPSFAGSENNLTSDLVIDPQLTWATFFGGSNSWEGAMSVATDASGNVFVTGYANSTNFPLQSSGAYFQGTKAGDLDVVILKFTNSGVLLWSTYYGGSGEDWSYSIVVDANLNLFITGHTGSANFPATTGTYGGSFDVFVLKFDNTGNRLWATWHGGSSDDEAKSLACDNAGNVFVTGHTWSNNFPVQSAGTFFQGAYAGGNIWGGDVFILKFNSTGNLLWSTYYGGSGADVANSITHDGSGNIFIAGYTTSLNFPVQTSGNYFQPNIGGGTDDVFLLKFDNAGNRLWATYYGGNGSDEGFSIGCDILGSAFVTGYTSSTNIPLSPPVSPGQTTASWAGTVVNDVSVGTVSWSTPSMAAGSVNDNIYGITGSISGGNRSNYLKATNYGITIPAGMIVTGVEVNVEWKASGIAVADYSVRLVVGGVISGTDQSAGTSVGITENIKTFGSSTNRWGLPLTAADVQSAGFGVAISVTKSGGGGQTASIDRISIVVHYAVSWSVFQSTNAGGDDGFILKFGNAGNLLNATYFGGSGNEHFNSSDNLAVDDCGSVNVSFETTSSDIFTRDSCDIGYWDNSFNGGIADQFIAHFTNAGVLLWATYLGGDGWEFRTPVAVDQTGKLFTAGEWISPTSSATYPVTNPGGGAYYQPAFAGGTDDMFLASFAFASDCPCGIAALPIELLSFSAEVTNDDNVLLQWATASEINNDYFTIERTKDGIAFEEVLRKKGAGNSTVTKEYSAMDNNPWSGTSYYRLKQTDFDGAFTYSEIVPVNVNPGELAVQIFPNPSDGKFLVNVESGSIGADAGIKIYNTLGEILFQSPVKERKTMIDVSRIIREGIYFILINTGKETVVRKIRM